MKQEMIDWFEIRTNRHIGLVQKYWRILQEQSGDPVVRSIFLDDRCPGAEHDASKFEEPEYTPYLYINWNYRCIREKVPFEIPEHMKEACNEATWHHIKHNSHHPEYWDDKAQKCALNAQDRDKPSGVLVDATKMPDLAIAEMCCDWCAMAEELGTNPFDWAKSNINIRWKFTQEQARYIYEILEMLWT